MNLKFDYRPLPVFEPFHASTAKDRFVFGGYGSGKSHAACAEAIAWGLEQPGSEILVTRKTVPALRDTTEKIFVSLLPPEFLAQCHVARAGGHLEHIRFPTGSVFYFRGMPDWKRLRSMNLAAIVWDEADEYTLEEFDGMQSRVRQTKPTPEAVKLGYTAITRRGNILASNPNGHNFLWDISVNPDGRRFGTAFFTSTSFDNPYLPADYLDMLLAMPDPWVRRYVLCSFEEFAGAIYPDWSWDSHVIEPFKTGGKYRYAPGGFFRMGFDPGTAAGNAAVWCYYDTATHILVAVADYNEVGLSATKHASAWRRIEAQHGMQVQRRLADPKAVNIRDRGSNVSLREQYARKGFNFQLGPSDVRDRYTALGDLIYQGRFKCTNECPRLYEQLLSYKWADLTPTQIAAGRDQQPLKKDVDLVDAAQYAVSNYVPPPKVKPTQTAEEHGTAAVHAAIRKQLRKRKQRAGGAQHDLGGIHV